MPDQKNILFIITEDWYYLSHRRDLALFAKINGCKITILTKINSREIADLDKDINLIDWNIERASKNIIRELKSILKINQTIKKIKPDIIHAVGIKPIIYSGILSRINKKISFLYAFAGLGSIFTNTNYKKYILQKIILFLMKFFFRKNNSLIVFQNNEDLNLFNSILNLNINKEIIRGSGINPNDFSHYTFKDSKKLQILLPSRLLFDKGIEDFIFCAIEIKKKFKDSVNFVIAGKIDVANPSSVPLHFIDSYIKDKIIIWIDGVDDIKEIYDKTHIVCFPSFREGNPRALLESACCELAIIAYDVAGCNDIITHNNSGILIPFRDKIKMKESLEKLITDDKLRKFLGVNARKRVVENYSNDIIFKQYLKIWKSF